MKNKLYAYRDKLANQVIIDRRAIEIVKILILQKQKKTKKLPVILFNPTLHIVLNNSNDHDIIVSPILLTAINKYKAKEVYRKK